MKKKIVTGFFAALVFAGQAELPRPSDNQWEGAKVAVFGDSITDPAQTNSQRVYWQYLADWLKWNPAVFGISGHSWSNMPGQIDRAENAMGDEVDAVTIFLGTVEEPVDLGFIDVPESRFDPWPYYTRYVQQAWIDMPKLFEFRRAGMDKPIGMKPYRVGNFNLKPDARLKELMPQFESIPLDKIGLCNGKNK